MKQSLVILFLFTLMNARAQSISKTEAEAPDSLNATSIQSNVKSKHEIIIVNGTQYLQILNVDVPTDVVMMDLSGKIVYKVRIDQSIRIEKDNFGKGFYLLRIKSIKNEAVKKLYL